MNALAAKSEAGAGAGHPDASSVSDQTMTKVCVCYSWLDTASADTSSTSDQTMTKGGGGCYSCLILPQLRATGEEGGLGK